MSWEKTSAEHKENMAKAVFDMAAEMFAACGESADFCVRSTTDKSAVFGERQRVYWWPRVGFRADRDRCSEEFLREWDARYRGGATGGVVPRPPRTA
jgi:hypothetical protein